MQDDDRARVLLSTLSLQYRAGVQGRNVAVHSLALSMRQDPQLDRRLRIEVAEQGVAQPADGLLRRWRTFAPDVLGLSCYVWNTTQLVGLAERLREQLPATRIVLGGPDAAPRAELLMTRHPFVDAVALGEGEEALRGLLRRLVGLDSAAWRQAPGFLSRVDGELVRTPPAIPVDPERLPSLLDAPGLVQRHGSLTLQGARGCRYRCAYCQYNDRPRRERSLAALTAELERFAAAGGGSVHVLDAGVNQSEGRLRGLLEVIAAHPELGLGAVEVNLETLTDADISLLAAVDTHLAVGLQTTNPAALRAVRRGYDPKRFGERAEALHRWGVGFTIDVIYGLPGDDYAAFVRSMSDAYALRPRLVLPFHLQVLPGSTFARERERWQLDYDPEPPYLLRSCETFGVEDLTRASLLGHANDLMHAFSMDSGPWQALARDLGRDPPRWLEELLAGAWRGGAPVGAEELSRWADPRHIKDLWSALRRWIFSSYAAAARPSPPPDLMEAWEAQWAHATVRYASPLPADLAPAVWPPPVESSLGLAPGCLLRRLLVPLLEDEDEDGEQLEFTHCLLSPEPGGLVRETLLPELLGQVLERADGHRSLGAVLGAVADEALGPDEHAQLVEALADALESVWEFGVLRLGAHPD